VDGTRLLEEAIEVTRASGQVFLEPIGLMLLARSLARIDEPGAALRRAGEALAIARREMPFHEVDAQVLHGELLGATGADPAEVESTLGAAVAIASGRRSVAQELRARAALRRWYRQGDRRVGTGDDDRLEELRRRFPAIAAAVELPPGGGGD
jgi:hypothetical protein